MSQDKSWTYNETAKIITIHKNGLFKIGPEGEEVLLQVAVGVQDALQESRSGESEIVREARETKERPGVPGEPQEGPT